MYVLISAEFCRSEAYIEIGVMLLASYNPIHER